MHGLHSHSERVLQVPRFSSGSGLDIGKLSFAQLSLITGGRVTVLRSSERANFSFLLDENNLICWSIMDLGVRIPLVNAMFFPKSRSAIEFQMEAS